MSLMYLFCRMKGKGCYNLCIGNGIPHISYRAILVQPEEGKFVWDDGDLHLLQSTKKKIKKEKKIVV